MTDTRTQALAAQYSRIMGTEDQAYHLGAMPAVGRTTIATCPSCGTKATVLEDRAAGLLERWRREHDEHDKQQTA